jgi:hypothetical protein
MADLETAEQFLAGHARVLERRRFARLFRDGPGTPVRDAIAAYRNDDGGFGHGLEPDGRGAGSQPIAAISALNVLDEADVWDEMLVTGVCDWLERTAPEEGGATFVLPEDERWPTAPFWRPTERLAASPTSTGQIAAPLLRRGVTHPWLDRATQWLWREVEEGGAREPSIGTGYDARGLTVFLNAVPDEARAQAALDALAPFLRAVTKTDPRVEEELQSPLDLAPHPEDRARRLFDQGHVDAFLDALGAGQQSDGGWDFPWAHWSPAAVADSRGVVTVEALRVLRANGRL